MNTCLFKAWLPKKKKEPGNSESSESSKGENKRAKNFKALPNPFVF